MSDKEKFKNAQRKLREITTMLGEHHDKVSLLVTEKGVSLTEGFSELAGETEVYVTKDEVEVMRDLERYSGGYHAPYLQSAYDFVNGDSVSNEKLIQSVVYALKIDHFLDVKVNNMCLDSLSQISNAANDMINDLPLISQNEKNIMKSKSADYYNDIFDSVRSCEFDFDYMGKETGPQVLSEFVFKGPNEIVSDLLSHGKDKANDSEFSPV